MRVRHSSRVTPGTVVVVVVVIVVIEVVVVVVSVSRSASISARSSAISARSSASVSDPALQPAASTSASMRAHRFISGFLADVCVCCFETPATTPCEVLSGGGGRERRDGRHRD